MGSEMCIRDSVSADMDVALNSAVTIVDAAKCKMYMKNFGEFFNNQIENAGTVVLSRTDITDTAKIQKDVEMIREKNPKAAIVTTPLAELGGSQLLEIIEKRDTMLDDLLEEVRESHHHHDDDDDEDEHEHHHDHDEDDDHDEHEHHHHDHDDHDHCCCGHHHDHDADEVFTSWGVETARKFTKAEVEHALTELDTGNYGMILRSKGIVDGGADGWLEFDYVPGEWEVRSRSADVGGKLVVIGSKLNETAIAQLFGC